MAEVRHHGLIRVLRTPMRDFVRGRMTGRLDWKYRIDTSDLPTNAKEVIRRVVRRTRLWKLEQTDVTDELLAHFADGLESGTPLEELLAKFGDVRRVAKLIRRAKRRNRPLVWHAFRGLGWLIAVMLLFYAGLTAYFFTGEPSPSVDYVAILNEDIAHVPASEQAWPIYRNAILSLTVSRDGSREWPKVLRDPIDGPHWPEMVIYLEQHADAIEMIRQASRKPALGFLLGPNGSKNDPELWAPYKEDSWALSPDSLLRTMMDVPFLRPMSLMARLLAADAQLARQQNDAERFKRDVDGMFGLARQSRTSANFILCQLVGLNIYELALHHLDRAIRTNPELLEDAQLQRFAHDLSVPRVAADFINLSGEKMMFHDLIQRMYTDDGNGDGRLTPRGQRMLPFVAGVCLLRSGDWAARDVIGRAVFPFGASRREMLSRYDQLIEMDEANLHKELREIKASNKSNLRSDLADSLHEQAKFGLLIMLHPSADRQQSIAERSLGHRDGIIVGIALELYRRENGRYPKTLNELTPRFLAAVPIDRIDGQPVRYRPTDAGTPLVYSVGADHDDDGGRVPMTLAGSDNRRAAEWYPTRADQIADGDWILYPEPE